MKRQDATWMLLAPAMAVFGLLMGEPLRAEVFEQTKTVAGTTVQYKIVLPDGTTLHDTQLGGDGGKSRYNPDADSKGPSQ